MVGMLLCSVHYSGLNDQILYGEEENGDEKDNVRSYCWQSEFFQVNCASRASECIGRIG